MKDLVVDKVLTASRLRKVLSYDAGSGHFRWLVRPSNRVRIGDIAGSRHGAGYIQINIDGQNYLAHRLAWLYVTGSWPRQVVDHINAMRTDNRFCNLRDVRTATNCENITRPYSTNSSGLLGVSWSKRDKVWVAQISVGNRTRYIGSFRDKDDAFSAYLEEKRRLHIGCTI